jgi:alpha-tubulin suppressor-like RCC1 family protein
MGFGRNNNGQLGLGNRIDKFLPSALQADPELPLGDKNVIGIDAGKSFSGFVLDDGSLWTFGCNQHGQLGFDTKSQSLTDRWLPRKVKFGHKVVGLVCGWEHLIVKTEAGEVWACGNNESGQLGIGSGEVNTNGE